MTTEAFAPDDVLAVLPPHWHYTGSHLRRTFENPSYKAALSFVQAIGEYAESVDHHPEIYVTWPETTITWWTHTANGVTQKDLDAANQVNALFDTL